MPRFLIYSFIAAVTLINSAFASPHTYQIEFVRTLPGLPFDHYRSPRESAPDLHFYLARADATAPLLVLLQGSGCASAFGEAEDGSVFSTLAQERIVRMARNRFSILVVDKVGVTPGTFYEDGGDMEQCSDITRDLHTLDSWSETVSAAIDTAKSLTGVGANHPISLLGFSEGAMTSARLASMRTDISHITFISGFGCLLFDDLVTLAERKWQARHSDLSDDELQAGLASAAQAMRHEIEQILASPHETHTLFEGHTPKYWSSVGFACPAQDLANSGAKVSVIVGLDDASMIADGAEEIVMRRLQRGKDTKIIKVVNGNHGLGRPEDEMPFARLLETFEAAIEWMAQS